MKKEIQVSEKNIPLRAIGFFLAVAVALGAFLMAVFSLRQDSEGYRLVEGLNYQDTPLYQTGIELNYMFSGTSSEIRTGFKSLQAVYSEALHDSFRELDCAAEYEDVVNLATLNARRGEPTEVSEELFAVLTDAYERTCRQEGYSMFAGALYAQWQGLLYQSDAAALDPLHVPEEAELQTRLATATGELRHFTFRVTDPERREVLFDVDGEYRELLEELGIDAPVLDLNLLHDAYELDLVRDRLKKGGWTAGWLSAESGLTLLLPGQEDLTVRLYGQAEGNILPAAEVSVSAGAAVSRFRAFALTKNEGGYYLTEDDSGAPVPRHPYLTARGVKTDVLASSLALSGQGRAADVCYANAVLWAQTTPGEVRAAAQESSVSLCWTLAGEQKLYTNAAGEEITPAAEYGWTAGS